MVTSNPLIIGGTSARCRHLAIWVDRKEERETVPAWAVDLFSPGVLEDRGAVHAAVAEVRAFPVFLGARVFAGVRGGPLDLP